MKLLIAVDMEGITGVVDWNHVDATHSEYQRFRRLMTQDVNAAIAGAVEAGVDDIVVSDGHSSGRNILIEELNSRARLNTGSPSPFSMVQGIDNGVDAAFFIGYHAHMSTAKAVLAHTWSSARISNVWLNGKMIGEIGLNASVCGHFGAPVLMISGCKAACAEASEWIPGIETAPVKVASGRYAAECLPPEVTHKMIQETAVRAIRKFKDGKGPAPLKAGSPVKITIEFINTGMVDMASFLPGAVRLDGRRTEFEAPDMPTAYRNFRASATLGG